MAEPSPAARIQRLASTEQRRYLAVCAETASRFDTPLYLVGGAIRDWLLTGEFLDLDLDLVAEGNAMDLAAEVAHQLGGDLRTHDRFLTAEIVVDHTHIDIVTARKERYDEPASLPVVSPADLEADLARRDFSVNAMALPLWPVGSGGIVDPWGGRSDLEQRRLRVLHDRSFFDDPTRILRGVRIGARRDLDFEPQTTDLARAAVDADAFGPLSPSRLRHEMVLLLEDQQVELSLHRLEELGFFPVLGRTNVLSEQDWVALRGALKVQRNWDADGFRDLDPRWWLVNLMSFSAAEDEAHRALLAQRLGLDEPLSEILAEYPAVLQRASRHLENPDLSPHDVCPILDGLRPEELALLWATGPDRIVQEIDRWSRELRDVRLTIDGTDLKEEGFAESPDIGRALQSTLDARLDGSIEATEELEFALRQMKGEKE